MRVDKDSGRSRVPQGQIGRELENFDVTIHHRCNKSTLYSMSHYSTWSTDDVVSWLENLDFTDLVPFFRKQEVIGEDLTTL